MPSPRCEYTHNTQQSTNPSYSRCADPLYPARDSPRSCEAHQAQRRVRQTDTTQRAHHVLGYFREKRRAPSTGTSTRAVRAKGSAHLSRWHQGKVEIGAGRAPSSEQGLGASASLHLRRAKHFPRLEKMNRLRRGHIFLRNLWAGERLALKIASQKLLLLLSTF